MKKGWAVANTKCSSYENATRQENISTENEFWQPFTTAFTIRKMQQQPHINEPNTQIENVFLCFLSVDGSSLSAYSIVEWLIWDSNWKFLIPKCTKT